MVKARQSKAHVGAIVVTWNAERYLERCIRSLHEDGVAYRNMVVVDQGSTDGSRKLLMSSFPWVRVITGDNTGYGCAVNKGYNLIHTPFFIVANPDTEVAKGSLCRLVETMELEPDAGVVGGSIRNESGQEVTRFSKTSMIRAVGLLTMPRILRGHWTRFVQKTHQRTAPSAVKFVEGCFLLIRREAFEQVGGFDEHFSFYSEDADLSTRMRAAGWKCLHVPDAPVMHIGGGSFRDVPSRQQVEFYMGVLRLYRRHWYRRYVWFRNLLRLISLVPGREWLKEVLVDTRQEFRYLPRTRVKQVRSGHPSVSVIVPTLNRPACAIRLLKALEQQTFRDFEVILVDQGNGGDFQNLRRNTFSFGRLKIVPCVKTHRCVAKNVALRIAAGQILLFCDDDIVPPRDFLATHVYCHRDPTVGGVSCRVLERGLPKASSKVVLWITAYGRMIAEFHANVEKRVGTLAGQNMSIKREVQRRVGFFDPLYAGTSVFEEPDISIRIRRLGYDLLFTNRVSVEHFPQPGGNDDFRKKDPSKYYYWFHHNEIVYFLKHHHRFCLFLVIPFCFLRSIKQSLKLIGSIKGAEQMFAGVFAGSKTYFRMAA